MHDPIGHINGGRPTGTAVPKAVRRARGPGSDVTGKSFIEEMKGQLAEANRLRRKHVAAEDLVAGRRDDPEVMIATERGHRLQDGPGGEQLVDAYEEVKNLRV